MLTFTKVKRAVTDRRRSVGSSPKAVTPIPSPYTKKLRAGSTVELARVKVDLRREKDGVLLIGTVNWSATFPANAFDTGGWAEATFELLRNGAVIYRVHQSAVQAEEIANSLIPPQLTVFRIATLRYFDTASVFGKPEVIRYTMRATNIITVNPSGEGDNIKANVGPVILTALQIEGAIPAK